MSVENDALFALKNAWNGALAASERLRELGPDADLEAAATAALANAIAAQALRGLIEELLRKRASATSEASGQV